MSICNCVRRTGWLEQLEKLPKIPIEISRFVSTLRHFKIEKSTGDKIIEYVDHFFSAVKKDYYLAEKTGKKPDIVSRVCDLQKNILNIQTEKGDSLIVHFASIGDLTRIRGLFAIGSIKTSEEEVLKIQQELSKASKAYQNTIYGDLIQDLSMKTKNDKRLEELTDKLKGLKLEFNNPIQLTTSKGQILNYRFTPPFLSDGFHNAAIPIMFFLLEHEGTTYPRLCWLSQSQMIWRITTKLFEDGWISKSSLKEEAIALPIHVNIAAYKALKETIEAGQLIRINSEISKDILPYIISLSKHPKKGGEVIREEGKRAKFQYPNDNETDIDAESFHPSEYSVEEVDLKVDFSTPLEEQDFKHITYDEKGNQAISPLNATVFSASNEIRCLFLEHDGRVFLATAEQKSWITKHGVRRKVIKLGELTTPLKEYRTMFNDKKDFWPETEKHQSSPYVSTWNYLRTLSIIRKYYTEYKHQSIPKELE